MQLNQTHKTKNVKKQILTFGIALSLLAITSCGSDDTKSADEKSTTETSNANCSGKNQIDKIMYEGEDQAFEQKYVYANFNSMYQSYRVIYINFDKSQDSDFGAKTGDQKRVVVMLFSPKDDEFKPGKYTWSGDENGMNKIAVQVETADGIKSCNYAGIDDPGYVEIFEVNKEHICGKFHVNGQGFELSGSFDTKHESIN